MVKDAEYTRVALVVENDQELRALAVALLEETGLQVVEASSAEQALQYLCYNARDVAFLFSDVKLPCVMNGVDLARAIRLKWPWIRTVLTSDVPPADDLDKTLRQVRFMPKPWLPLAVLVEAEKAVQVNRFEEAAPHRQAGAFATARM